MTKFEVELRAQLEKAAGTNDMQEVLAERIWARYQQNSVVLAEDVVADAVEVDSDYDANDSELQKLRRELIAIFRRLEKKDLGEFTVGRKNNKSRFEFFMPDSKITGASKSSRETKHSTKAKLSKETKFSKRAESAGTHSMYEIPFPVRAGVSATLKLPKDLTADEAERLASFIKLLVHK